MTLSSGVASEGLDELVLYLFLLQFILVMLVLIILFKLNECLLSSFLRLNPLRLLCFKCLLEWISLGREEANVLVITMLAFR
jgi:Na+/serine symporter